MDDWTFSLLFSKPQPRGGADMCAVAAVLGMAVVRLVWTVCVSRVVYAARDDAVEDRAMFIARTIVRRV